MTAKEIIRYMESQRNEEQRRVLMGFFKTAPGEYGYGDEFLGLKVPQTREVVQMAAKDTPLREIPELLMSRWHEVRLCGLLILVWRFERLSTKRLAGDARAIRQRDENELKQKHIQQTYHNKMLTVLSATKLYDVLKAEDRFHRQKFRNWSRDNRDHKAPAQARQRH